MPITKTFWNRQKRRNPGTTPFITLELWKAPYTFPKEYPSPAVSTENVTFRKMMSRISKICSLKFSKEKRVQSRSELIFFSHIQTYKIKYL